MQERSEFPNPNGFIKLTDFVGIRLFRSQALFKKPRRDARADIAKVYLKRPEWFYEPGILCELPRYEVAPKLPVTAAQISFCERLLAAYQKASHNLPSSQNTSGIWQDLVSNSYQQLESTLVSADAGELARLLSAMFQEKYLFGIASAAQGLEPQHAPFVQVKLIEELLALAEALGVVRTETPEQGEPGHALLPGFASLVEKIEEALGLSIDFPRVGGVYGLVAGRTLITPEAPEHIYVATRINEAIASYLEKTRSAAPRIVEIGAGFGGTAHWLLKLRRLKLENYTIIDLPLMNAFQGYFLAQVFGDEKIQLFGEPLAPTHLISIVPARAKESVAANFDVLINENSMPEIPESVVADYLNWSRKKLNGIFYSYNQEAYSRFNGVLQTSVPEQVAEVGGFTRLSRNFSWLRRGYVEEIYRTGSASA